MYLEIGDIPGVIRKETLEVPAVEAILAVEDKQAVDIKKYFSQL